MRKIFLTIFVITATTLFANAQQIIELPYSKMINKNAEKWDKWNSKWDSEEDNVGSSPLIIFKKESSTKYWLMFISNFPESMTGVFEDVVYDTDKTRQIREKNSNPNLTAYKYENSGRYLWTDNITLDEICRDPSKWKATKNAKIYFWDSESALLYTSGVGLSASQIEAMF